MQAKTKNKLTITLTIVLFASPVVVAYLLSSGIINYHPGSTKNNGVFVSPLVKMSDYSDKNWVKNLMGHWTLIRRVPEVCNTQCQVLEDELVRYQLSLGHRADKLKLLLLSDGFQTNDEDPYTMVEKVDISKNTSLKTMFNDLSQMSLKKGHGMYVVAPEGYLMMAFTEHNTTTEIIRDLSLLVKRKGD